MLSIQGEYEVEGGGVARTWPLGRSSAPAPKTMMVKIRADKLSLRSVTQVVGWVLVECCVKCFSLTLDHCQKCFGSDLQRHHL